MSVIFDSVHLTTRMFFVTIGHMKRQMEAILYPVTCFITGTTPNGGGIWKYILHASRHGLLRRNIPVLTQVLHFLDFRVSPRQLENRWRKSLRENYNGNFQLQYKAPIFTDSGGFTLMFDPDLDLSAYNIMPDQLAEGILQLQIDLGADLVTSLDYPIPPGLDISEVERRMVSTLDNAMRSARYIANLPQAQRPLLYVPIHGPTPELLGKFVSTLLERFEVEGLSSILSGLALGSMVPLRKTHRTEEIVKFTRAARRSMPQEMPLHVFGVTGVLVPFLMAEGANTFDTSSYVQNARNLKYMNPVTRKSISFRDMVEYNCNCIVCRERNFHEDIALMEGRKAGLRSEVYAAIALHNLEQDFVLLNRANEALINNELSEYIEEVSSRFEGARKLLAALKAEDTTCDLKQVTVHQGIRMHKPEDFDIQERNYTPQKPICLLLPCSQEKPYTNSQSFRFIWKNLGDSIERMDNIEIVFLSGLYGPVPEGYVEEDAVTTYDFLLHHYDQQGIERIAARLSQFLDENKQYFETIVAYMTLPAYRKAVRLVKKNHPELLVLPETKRLGQASFYKKENLYQLIECLRFKVRTEAVSKDVDAQELVEAKQNSSAHFQAAMERCPLPCNIDDQQGFI